MDSEKIRERADSVLQHAKNLLLEDESEVEDDTVENDEETVSKNGNAEDDHGENDGKKTDDENTKETKSDSSKPKSKKSSKGKMMERLISPLIPKFLWKIDLNLGVKASNQRDQLNENNDTNPGTSSPKSALNKREDETHDDWKIKQLEKDKKNLRKLANTFLNGLEEKKLELSKLEGQLGALQVDNDRLKTELNDLQELKQRLTCNLEVHNEKHRNEVKRFDLELKTATESMAKMILTNQNEMEESRQLRIDFDAITKARADLKEELKEKEMLYRSELNNLNESLQQSKLENTKLTDLLDEMKVTYQKQNEKWCKLRTEVETFSNMYFTSDDINMSKAARCFMRVQLRAMLAVDDSPWRFIPTFHQILAHE